MTRSSDAFAKALGLKKPANAGHFTPLHRQPSQPKRVATTREERVQDKAKESAEREKIKAERAEALRRARLDQLYRDHKAVRRFVKTLVQVEPEAEYTGFRDCDVDLAELARDCGLHECTLRPYEAYTVYEEATEFVIRLAKRKRVKRADVYDGDGAWFQITPPTALDELKSALNIN